MLRLAWKSVKHNPKRLILTTIAIILATSFVSGTFVLTNTVQNSFNAMFDEIYAASDITVRPVSENSSTSGFSMIIPSFDDKWLEPIAAVDGVEVAQPGSNGIAVMLDSEGKPLPMGPPVIIINWSGIPNLDNVTIAEGRGPQSDSEIALDVDAAKKAGYEIGDTVTINRFSESEQFTFTLVGTINFGKSNGLNGASLAYFTMHETQVLARQEGELATVTIKVADGYSPTEVRAAITEILPANMEAKLSEEMVDEGSAEVAKYIDIFNTFLLIFAIIAVFVGALLITNTFMTIVTQRTREFGLLRAIAASPRQILGMILLEAVIIGVVGSVIGLAVGYGFAAVIKVLLGVTAGMAENLGALTLPLRAIIWGLVTGVGTTIVAATLPALHASRITPMEALRDEATRKRRGLRVRTQMGLGFLAAGAVAFVIGFATDILFSTVVWVGIGAALFLIGTILISAVLVAPAARGLRPAFAKVFGLNGKIAMNNAQREPRRTANTAAALMLGVLLLSLITTVATSIKSVVRDQLTGTSAAEFFVSGNIMTDPLAPIPDDALLSIREIPEVRAVHYYGWDTAEIDGKFVDIVGIDAKTAQATYAYNVDPSFALLDRGEIYVSPAVLADGYDMGDTITLTGIDASMTFTITGTYLQEGDPSYWIDFQDARVLHEGLAAVTALVDVADTADPEQARPTIESAVADYPRLLVQTGDELSNSVNKVFNQLLTMLSALLSMALVIAIFGVANTLFLSVAERTREIGLLRAVGVGRKAVRRMITLESVFISVLGAVLGLILGVGIGAALVMSFDTFSEAGVSIPWTDLGVYTVLAVIAGIVAAILPARRASNLNILEAVTTE